MDENLGQATRLNCPHLSYICQFDYVQQVTWVGDAKMATYCRFPAPDDVIRRHVALAGAG